jgi:hypothetical protein
VLASASAVLHRSIGGGLAGSVGASASALRATTIDAHGFVFTLVTANLGAAYRIDASTVVSVAAAAKFLVPVYDITVSARIGPPRWSAKIAPSRFTATVKET